MTVLNVAFIGSEELARRLGKKGDVRDIESYVHKESRNGKNAVLSFLRPLRHPERIRPLLSVLDVARTGIVEVQRIDAALGEVMVALSCAGIKNGHVVISPEKGEWVDVDQVKIIIGQAGLENWQIHEGELDEHSLRDSLFQILDANTKELEILESAPLVLPVDQSFNVKGVGLVAIGFVQSGSVSKHDDITVLPSGESGVARSLQVMDDDVDKAVFGDRVGIALRNLREKSLQRGSMVVSSGSDSLVCHEKSTFEIIPAPFQKRNLVEGDVVHAASNLQFVVGRISSIERNTAKVSWDSPLWIRSDGQSRIVVVQLDSLPMRIIGSASDISEN